MTIGNQEIQQSIQDAIQKHLPAQVSTTLQERLAQADKFEKEIERLRDNLDSVRKANTEYAQEIQDLKSKLYSHAELDKRKRA